MKEEIQSIPITREHVLAIAGALRQNPRSPLVVPLSYSEVTVPGALPECIEGVLHDPGTLLVNHNNVRVGPAYFLADNDGHVYEGRATGITPQTLAEMVTENTTAFWALQLNLADPDMPRKLAEFHRAFPAIGLAAIVIPQAVQEYMRGFSEFEPVLYNPHSDTGKSST